MELIPAAPVHAEVLAALHAPSFDPPWGVAAMASALATPGTFGFIAMEDKQPVGFVLGRSAADECEVLTLTVLTDVRRRGVARKLMQALTATALTMGAVQMFLEVADDNLAARGLYESFGFIEVGRRTGYYPRVAGPVDALVMALKL